MYDICDGEITVNDGFPLFMFPLNGTDDLLVPSFRDQKISEHLKIMMDLDLSSGFWGK